MSAKIRLTEGKSAYKGEETDKNLAQRVMDVTSKLITCQDTIALGQTCVDDITGPTRDIVTALNDFPGLPANFQGKAKMSKWVDTLNGMNAIDTISED